jgi:hypothetical protein
MAVSTVPRSRHTICHGTRLEWCSSSLTTISSPGWSVRPTAWATRLRDSVVPRVNTISSRVRAPRKARTASRAASYSSVASSPRVWIERCTLAWLVS